MNLFFCSLIVRKYAQERIAPFVARMDEHSAMDEEVIRSLFEQGVCIGSQSYMRAVQK